MSETSNNDKYKVLETENWNVFTMTDQRYLGRCVVVLKRHCGDLSGINDEEMLDFINVVRKLEFSAKKAFNATMFNWTCLMNLAYQVNPPNPQVHWHFRPRYNHEVDFAGKVFIDPNFGHHYLREGSDEIMYDHETLIKITNELKKFLK